MGVCAFLYPCVRGCAFECARARVRARACLSANRCQPVPHNPMRDAEPARTCHAFARRSLGMILVGDLHCEAVAVEVNLDLLLCPVVLVAVSRAECTPAPRKRTGSPIRLVWGGLYTCNQRRENQRRRGIKKSAPAELGRGYGLHRCRPHRRREAAGETRSRHPSSSSGNARGSTARFRLQNGRSYARGTA